MRAAALPARFTIEQKSDPLGRFRYLATNDNGFKIWSIAEVCDFFFSEELAENFRTSRMLADADDAVVVRHTVH